ncbi:uncharacterized protein BXZ73DRAFT_105903 [Epithele typhae]|uniref:uncharacterized protein n=1 Tax=Epithele typhae TaxID=378194 RepID=UPI0020078B60|nr:uncharacterized protein BXZ73DRAFT_105903 [Epithele typhae]KAH9916274.1 hypothetical protein BXZ73DRAFT_105903 [Epithele typhae]
MTLHAHGLLEPNWTPPNLPAGTPVRLLHWRIVLEIPGKESVLVDINSPNFQGGTSIVSAMGKSGVYGTSHNSTDMGNRSNWDKKLPSNTSTPLITPDLIVRFIKDEGLDQYTFNAQGSGCLHWVSTFIYHGEKKKLFPPGTHDSFLRFVRELRTGENARIQANPMAVSGWIPHGSIGYFTKPELNYDAARV